MQRHQTTILFADDDEDILFAGALLLREKGFRVHTVQDPELLPDKIKELQPHLLLLDMNFRSSIHNGNEGMYWLRRVKKAHNLPVIMVTAFGEIELAVESIKEGAADFITKPWQNQKFLETIDRTLQRFKEGNTPKADSRSAHASEPLEQLIGESASMKSLKETIRKIAPTDASVLILGENGTGKGLVAKAIHQLSKRKKNPFVAVDLGAVPEGLFESTMFGHKKGAFTDAKEDLQGRFVQANEGTLFLDELGNIPLSLQAKLLVALQNRQIQALGTKEIREVDIRVISATNASLDEMLTNKLFRQDLLYRLNTVTLHLPPLRERLDDLPALTNSFLSTFSERYGKEVKRLSPNAENRLKRHSWPGNIRELQHVLERAVILCEGEIIEEEDIQLDSHTAKSQRVSYQEDAVKLEDMEKKAIVQALEKHQGNISAVALELGLSRAALYRRLSKYNL